LAGQAACNAIGLFDFNAAFCDAIGGLRTGIKLSAVAGTEGGGVKPGGVTPRAIKGFIPP
jgi:hypothetical protein